MPRHRWKYRMYRELADEAPAILDEARKAASDVGLGAPIARPGEAGPIARPGEAGPIARSGEAGPISRSGEAGPGARSSDAGSGGFDRIRDLVKSRYSDNYDCCIVETPSAGLWAACQAAFAEAVLRQGYTPRCLWPRQKGLAVLAGILPPKYRHVYGGRIPRHPVQTPAFDVVVTPLEGATYANHGISNTPASLLAAASPEPSLEALAAAAEVHAPFLSGIYAQGPSTPGCGFGSLDEDGIHLLQKGCDELSAEFDVALVVDDSHALPLLGEIPAHGSSVTVFGHRALGGFGMAVGTEDLVAALRAGSPQPGDLDVSQLFDTLSGLVENRDRFRRNLTRLYERVTEALGRLESEFRSRIRVRKDLPSLSVEINYEDTWQDGTGFPIFTVEDSKTGTNLLEAGIAAMGLTLVASVEASITVRLPDPVGGRSELDEDRAAREAKGLVRLLEILGKRSGYLD
ncbi:MAG: hypothetical protein ACM3WU_03750 [Bacillota bacterium]